MIISSVSVKPTSTACVYVRSTYIRYSFITLNGKQIRVSPSCMLFQNIFSPILNVSENSRFDAFVRATYGAQLVNYPYVRSSNPSISNRWHSATKSEDGPPANRPASSAARDPRLRAVRVRHRDFYGILLTPLYRPHLRRRSRSIQTRESHSKPKLAA